MSGRPDSRISRISFDARLSKAGRAGVSATVDIKGYFPIMTNRRPRKTAPPIKRLDKKFIRINSVVMSSRCVSFATAILSLGYSPICAQSVVSARAGLVHFFEGSVSVDGQPLEQKFGKFYEVRQGSELRTDDGRAEVLLTPGVFIRIDQNSSMRMLSTRLSDTRVEFIGGSASLDSRNGASNAPVTLVYKGYQVHFREQGRYRFDSAPAELKVENGEAEVTLNAKSVVVASGRVLPFTPALASRTLNLDGGQDGLDRWASTRSEDIQANDASAASSDNLTSELNNPSTQAYDYGAYPYDPSLSPYGAALASPLSIYGSPMFGYSYIPLYRTGLIYGGYPYGYGYRMPGYVPPGLWRPPSRVSTITRPTTSRPPVVSHPIVIRHR